MITNHSFIRNTGLALIAIAAVSVFTGCSKEKESESAAPAPEAASSVTSPELFAQPVNTPEAADPATVLAVVNGNEITLGDFNQEMAGVEKRMQGRVPPERMAQMRMQMRDQLLDNMITRKVLVDEIETEKIDISDEEMAEAVTEITESLPPGMTLNDMLAQTQTTEEEFKTTLASELQIRKLIETHIGEPTPPTVEELEAFYTENKDQFERPETVSASHILIGFEDGDTDEQKAAKRAELEDIRTQIVDGADFAEMAKAHSTGPSGPKGGELGSFPRGAMVPAFEETAFAQEVDSVSDIVETQFGYHIIKVTARNEAGVTPLEEVKEQLSEYLGNQKQQKDVQEFVKTLREKADVSFPGQDAPVAN